MSRGEYPTSNYPNITPLLCFDLDAVMDLIYFYCLHPLLSPVNRNPYGLRSRDHNFQLPVFNLNFRRNSFTVRNRYRFKWFFVFLLSCMI